MRAALLAATTLVGGAASGSESQRHAHLADPCDALRRLAGSTRPYLWLNASGWENVSTAGSVRGPRWGPSTCCGWHGVLCTVDGAVSALNLYGNRLEGTLPPAFGPEAFPKLRFLSVGAICMIF